MTRRQLVAGMLGLSAIGASGVKSVHAQSPLAAKTVKIVYPFAAGNAGNASARILGEQLQRILGAAVIIENRTEAAGRIGMQSVIRAEPDGITLLLSPLPLICMYPHSYKLDYDPFTDLAPISQVALFDVTGDDDASRDLEQRHAAYVVRISNDLCQPARDVFPSPP